MGKRASEPAAKKAAKAKPQPEPQPPKAPKAKTTRKRKDDEALPVLNEADKAKYKKAWEQMMAKPQSGKPDDGQNTAVPQASSGHIVCFAFCVGRVFSFRFV